MDRSVEGAKELNRAGLTENAIELYLARGEYNFEL